MLMLILLLLSYEEILLIRESLRFSEMILHNMDNLTPAQETMVTQQFNNALVLLDDVFPHAVEKNHH